MTENGKSRSDFSRPIRHLRHVPSERRAELFWVGVALQASPEDDDGFPALLRDRQPRRRREGAARDRVQGARRHARPGGAPPDSASRASGVSRYMPPRRLLSDTVATRDHPLTGRSRPSRPAKQVATPQQVNIAVCDPRDRSKSPRCAPSRLANPGSPRSRDGRDDGNELLAPRALKPPPPPLHLAG